MTVIRRTALLWLGLHSAAWAAPAVSDALAVGDCSGALSAQGATPASGATALALARCQLKLGKAPEALTTLSGMNDPRLAAYGNAVKGLALLEAGQAEAAIRTLNAALADATLKDPLRSQARFSLATARTRTGDFEGARVVFNALLTSSLAAPGRLPTPGGLDPAEVRWQLADTAVRRNAPARAVPVWQAIWTRNPTSPRASEAANRLAATGAPPQKNTALVLARIKTLEKLFRYKEALKLREVLPAGHASRSPKALARATFKARDYARSAQLHAALNPRTSDENLRLALARLRSGDYAGAMTQYKAMAAPGQPTVEMATWKLGYTAYDRGLIPEATAQLSGYLKRYPNGRYAQQARWFLGMAALRAGDKTTAKTRLAAMAKHHPKHAAGATYWLGRLAEDNGENADAQVYFQAVLRRWPNSGYAWFAAERLNRTWARRAPVAPPSPPAALKTTEAWTIGTELSRAGLLEWGRPHLESLRTQAKTSGKAGALALAHALIQAGSYTKAKALARPFCGPAHRGGDPVAQQACYPRPSGNRVAALAKSAGLPESLPFAIMTAESALKPAVTSPAGARGLMQLMPNLAAELHPQVWPGRPYSEDDLYQPAYNATLGTTELAQLQQTFGNAGVQPSLPLVIAGYNGGSDAVTRWLGSWPEPPAADLFSENISYTETRKYVQRVLGFLQTYRYVYGE